MSNENVMFEALKKNTTSYSTYTLITNNGSFSSQVKKIGEETASLVIHFAIKKPINIDDSFFEFEKKEFIQDTYIQCPIGNLTLQEGFWPKIRLVHDYDGKDGKEVTNTSESFIVKKVQSKNQYQLLTHKLELAKSQLHDVVKNSCWVVYPLDMVQTKRQIYRSKFDPSIKLILGSTGIGGYQFYNHGTITCTHNKEDEILRILHSFWQDIRFTKSSPALVRLKLGEKLPPNLNMIENITDLCGYLCAEGFYYEEDEEE